MAAINVDDTPTSHRPENLKRKRLDLGEEETADTIKRQRILNNNIMDSASTEAVDESVLKKPNSSPIWEYFRKDSESTNKAICSICNQSVANNNGATTMMIKHIKFVHTKHYAKLEEDI